MSSTWITVGAILPPARQSMSSYEEHAPSKRCPRRNWNASSSASRTAAFDRRLRRCSAPTPTEIAIVRNATEALNTVLLGLPLRTVRPPVPAPTLDTLAETYERAIGPRTKLVLLTHPSNLTGQLLPVRRISTAAHCVGADVVVDGTQSCGVLADPITSFDCDYYGASAH